MSKVLALHPLLKQQDAGAVLDFMWDKDVNGLAFVGTDGEFLAVNPTLSKWLGYPPSELENMTFMDVTVHEDTKADLEAIDQVRRGILNAYTMLKSYRPRQGPPFDAELTVFPWKMAGEDVLFFYSQVHRTDPVRVMDTDELRVVWEFFKARKRMTITVFVATALLGEAAIQIAANSITHVTTLLGGGGG